MSLSINTNVSALTAQRNLGINSMDSATSLSKLSSGSRIPSAKFDAAGLAVGTKLNAEVESLRTASQNASQAGSMLQIADGALGTVSDILTRMKSLAVQSSSGQLADSERSLLNQEFTQLRSEIDRIAQDTDFNGTQLLNGGDIQAEITELENGQLAGAGIRLNFDTSVLNGGVASADGNAFRVTYDFTDNTTDGDSTDQQDTGNLTVTNLTTGEAQTINIREAVQAVTGEALDTTGEGAVGDDVFATNLSGSQTVDINFAGLGVSVTLDSNFDVDADMNATLGADTSGLATGGTEFAANATFTFNQSGDTNLTEDALATLAGLAAFDVNTGQLTLDIDEDVADTTTFNAVTGINFSLNGGAAGATAAVTTDGATDSTVDVIEATSGAVIASIQIGAAADTAGSNGTSNTFTLDLGEGVVGANTVASTQASFTYKVGTGTEANDDISITLDSARISALGIASATVDTAVNAEAAITDLDAAINTVSSRRADVGASQSRLDFAAASVNVAIENTTAARSGIMDADISQEMTEFTSKQVLVQAGVSMLAQANQQPSLLLRLLQ